MRRLIHSAATWKKHFLNKNHCDGRFLTWALNLPTSDCLKRNCLLRFDKSIVSMSITSMFLRKKMWPQWTLVPHYVQPEAHHGEVLEELTAKSASSNDQDLDVLEEEWQDFCWRSERWRSERSSPLEHLIVEVKIEPNFFRLHLGLLGYIYAFFVASRFYIFHP